MSNRKQKDLLKAHQEGKMGRRELLKRMGALGVGAAATSFMVNGMATKALAAGGVDFQKHKGKSLRLLMNKHPYNDALMKNLGNFKELTGMEVTSDIFPEDVYFDKVTTALASKGTQYDAFMTGAYQTWKYGPARQIVDLNEFIKDPKVTSDAYKWTDISAGLRASDSWDGKAGSKLGGPGAKQWAIPWGFELNSIAYNKRILGEMGIEPPKNLPDLIEKAAKISAAGKGVYGCGVRGSRSWATIHPGFLSAYANYGLKDFVQKGGKLYPAMNTPESKAFHKLWIELVQKGGPKNWTTYTWYEVGNDLGAGNSAMIFDADILGFFQNSGDTKEKGNLAYMPFASNPAMDKPTPNVWIWSLAMSAFSKNKEAAWYFIQWATGTQNTSFGALNADLVDPVRDSVWQIPEFQTRLEKFPGYLNQYQKSIGQSQIYFTPQQLFPEFTTDWAAMLQQMYSKEIPVDEGLDKLAQGLERKLRSVGL
ncbi:MAG TPA: extracellular solute-binding protein [Anaeromyxobacter sp.]|nr:extracellular solute-binding protein [Anaeromyxobacter sp.]